MQAKQFKHVAIDERSNNSVEKKKKNVYINKKMRNEKKQPKSKEDSRKKGNNNSNIKLKCVTKRFDPEQLCALERMNGKTLRYSDSRYFRLLLLFSFGIFVAHVFKTQTGPMHINV